MALRLYGIGSGKTISGMNRIASILQPDVIIDRDGEPDPKLYDGVFSHNTMFTDPFNGKLPRILFMASGKTGSVATLPKTIEKLKKDAPTEIWVNQESGRVILERLGLKARTMYRPDRLIIPEIQPVAMKKKRILWHFWGPGPWMPPVLEADIADAMRQLSDYEIQIIGGPRSGKYKLKPDGPGLDHVLPTRRIDLMKDGGKWAGIVRVYNVHSGLDLGRSTFQMLAYGRWYIYRDIVEPLIDTITHVRDIPDRVRRLCDKDTDRVARKRWKYINKNFTEELLHERWVNAVKEVING